jgi:hypothetical protein
MRGLSVWVEMRPYPGEVPDGYALRADLAERVSEFAGVGSSGGGSDGGTFDESFEAEDWHARQRIETVARGFLDDTGFKVIEPEFDENGQITNVLANGEARVTFR